MIIMSKDAKEVDDSAQCSVTTPIIRDVPLLLAKAEIVDVLYSLAHEIRLGLVHFVNQHFKQIAAVDVVLA